MLSFFISKVFSSYEIRISGLVLEKLELALEFVHLPIPEVDNVLVLRESLVVAVKHVGGHALHAGDVQDCIDQETEEEESAQEVAPDIHELVMKSKGWSDDGCDWGLVVDPVPSCDVLVVN